MSIDGIVFIKKMDALPAEVKNQIYIRIGQAADTLPPFGTDEYIEAIKAIAEKYLNER